MNGTAPQDPPRLSRLRARFGAELSTLTPQDPEPAPPSRLDRVRERFDAELSPAPLQVAEPVEPDPPARRFPAQPSLESGPPPSYRVTEVPPGSGREVATQFARGLGEAGLAAGIGTAELAAAASRDPGRLGSGLLPRDPAERERLGLKPRPEPKGPSLGERAAEGLRGYREETFRPFYGEPETPAGRAGGIAGRLAGETAMFMAPGSALRLGAGTRAIASEQGLRAALQALRSRSGRQGLAEAAGRAMPQTLRGRIGQDIALGAPIDAAIAAAGPEESMVGGVGEMLGDLPGGETLRRIAERPGTRVAADVVGGAGFSTLANVLLSRLGRGTARTAAADSPGGRPPAEPVTLPSAPPGAAVETPPVPAGAPRAPEPVAIPREPEVAAPARAAAVLRAPEPEAIRASAVLAAPEPVGELPYLSGATPEDVTRAAPRPVTQAHLKPGREVEPEGKPPRGQPGFLRVGNIGGWFRRHFTAAGDLPEPVFKRKIEKDGWTNSQLRQVRYTQRDFEKVTRQAYGRGGPTPEQLEQIDNALKGDIPAERGIAAAEVQGLEEATEARRVAAPEQLEGATAVEEGTREQLRLSRADRARRAIESLPEPLRPIVTKMRAEIDALSRHGIEEGLFEGPLAARVGDNLGVYATRSYRAFDDPQWAEKVVPEVRNRAKGLFRSEYPDMPEAEIDGLINEMLYRKEDGPIAFLARGKLGSKDMSLLMRRQDIHPDIRALLGEYRDPRVNYARSVAKMAQGIANHQFLQQVRADGLGQFLHERPVVRGDQSFHKQIAAEGSKAMEPLNGLYTTPEIERAFRDALDPAATGDWLRAYMKANSAAKYVKTILSPMTHVRNTVGNTGFALANGHWRAAKMGNAWRTTLADIGARSDPEARAYFRELQELGVVHEGVRAGELHDAIRDASKMDSGVYSEHVAERGLRKGLRTAEELYQAEDNVWKVFAYENELARYRKALPDVPGPELKKRAAAIVRDTYPTYSLVPGAVRALRRFPLLGTFVSFPAEVARTGFNTISLALGELRDPALRLVGAERLAGIIAATLSIPALTAGSRHLAGVTLDEDKDIRRFLPHWSKNSSLVYMGKGKDKWRFTDVSYTDPHSYLRKPVIAMLNGEDWESRLLDAVVEASSPFLSEDMLAEKLLDVSRNTRKDGRQVYNPQAPFPERLQAVTAHVWDGLEPGFVSQGRRIGMGLTGTQTVHGRSYDPLQEAAAVFTGFRMTELDVPQALSFRARDFTRELGDANRQLSAVASRRGTVTEEELRRAYLTAEQSRRELHERVYRDALAAMRLGMHEDDVEQVLASAGLSSRDVANTMEGLYEPRQIGGGFLAGVERSVEALTDDPDEAYEMFDRRREFLEGLAERQPEEVPITDRPPVWSESLPMPVQRLLGPGRREQPTPAGQR